MPRAIETALTTSRRAADWSSATARQIRDALHLSWLGLALVAGSLALVGLLFMALSAVSEDVIAGNGLQRGDLTELQVVQAHRTAVELHMAGLISSLGTVVALTGAGIAIAAFLWWRGERLFVAVAPLTALLVTGVIVSVGKQLVDRSRPPLGIRTLMEGEASFPSGHAGDSAALVLSAAIILSAVLLHRWWARVALVVAAGGWVMLVGLSRIVLGVHYPTDVLAGWLTGASMALLLTTGALLVRHHLNTTRAARQAPAARWRRVALAERGRKDQSVAAIGA